MRMSVFACGTVLAGLMCFASSEALARPKYNTEFWKMYDKELGKLKDETKCNACHAPDSKKKRNDYAAELKTTINSKEVGGETGKTGETDVAKIKKALELVAKKKSGTEGKTFGELIKEGKLPGGKETKEE
jgi:hypothetical protein